MQTPATTTVSGLFGTAAGGPSTGIFAEGAIGGDLFSMLLTGFDTATGQNQQNLPGGTAGDLLPGAAASLLTAQQINPTATTDDADALLSQEITPEQAGELLANLDAGSYGDPSGNEMLQQLHAQLETLAKGTEPKTVGEIIQAIAAPKADIAAATKAQPGTVQRAIAWFQVAFKKQNDNEQAGVGAQAVASTVADPNLQSLQACHFRPLDTADTAENGKAQTDEEPKTKIELIPVSQTILVPQWVASIVPEKPAVVDDAVSDLPELELPKIGGKMSSAADKLAEAQADFTAQQLGAQDAASKQAALGHQAAFKEALATQDAGGVADIGTSAANPSVTVGAVQTQTTQAPQAVSTVSLPPGMVNHAPVAEQVHVAISRAKKNDIDHITLQLEPAHLGRVEVQMRMGQDGQTQISFIADKAETFDALSRDARALESALQEAGIKADAGSMQFNLRQQPQQQLDAQFGQGQGGRSGDQNEPETTNATEIHAALSVSRHYLVNVQDGVDIHA